MIDNFYETLGQLGSSSKMGSNKQLSHQKYLLEGWTQADKSLGQVLKLRATQEN